MALTPEQRSLRSRAAAHILHSRYDPREITAPARQAFAARFEKLADPEMVLPEAERRRRADHLMRGYMSQLSLKASKARQTKTSGTTTAAESPAADANDLPTPKGRHAHADLPI